MTEMTKIEILIISDKQNGINTESDILRKYFYSFIHGFLNSWFQTDNQWETCITLEFYFNGLSGQ